MYSRYIKLEGNTFERGVQAGKLLKDRIQANYVNQKRHYDSTARYDFDEWAKTCEKYILCPRYTGRDQGYGCWRSYASERDSGFDYCL